MNSTNRFLIVMPHMDNPFFMDTVIYACEHNEEDALGIVIDKPSLITMGMIFAAADCNIPLRLQHKNVIMDGLVQIKHGYIVHTPIDSWQNSMVVIDNVTLTSSCDAIESLSKEGVMDKALVSIGYSKWGKGQLEHELAENVWLIVLADEHILFDAPYEPRYTATFKKSGVNLNALASRVDHA